VRGFDFDTQESRDAVTITSLLLDSLLDEFAPELAGMTLHRQVERIANEILKADMFEHEHAILTLAICFVRLLDARATPDGPDGDRTT
jgi:hypothetical protein